MQETQISENMRVVDHGTDKIDLNHLMALKTMGYKMIESQLTEVHFKEDGAKGDKPSLLFCQAVRDSGFVYSQVSLEMMNDCLQALGYRIVRDN